MMSWISDDGYTKRRKSDGEMSYNEYYEVMQNAFHIEDEDTVIKIPFENILEVTAEELIYKNNGGVIEKIVLDECVTNFNSAWGREARTQTGEIIKNVGGRYFAIPVAFYEFFTDIHHIRFCMTIQCTPFKKFLTLIGWNAYSKEFSEFYALQKKLRAAGYSVSDMT